MTNVAFVLQKRRLRDLPCQWLGSVMLWRGARLSHNLKQQNIEAKIKKCIRIPNLPKPYQDDQWKEVRTVWLRLMIAEEALNYAKGDNVMPGLFWGISRKKTTYNFQIKMNLKDK